MGRAQTQPRWWWGDVSHGHASAGDDGTYSVNIFSPCGSVRSLPATLSFQNCCPADFNGDSSVDFFDYLDFVAAFSGGC